MDAPIVETLLDQDLYSWTVAQVAFQKGHGNVPVLYEFKNRTKEVGLEGKIDLGLLRENIQHVRSLKPSVEEIEFLRNTGYFSDEFLRYFAYDMRLCEPDVRFEFGDLVIEIEDRWIDAIWWEVHLLSMVNEIYAMGEMTTSVGAYHEEGMRRLFRKVETLKTRPQLGFMEFGTRRRFSRKHQYDVLEYLLENIPRQVTGTSNVNLARQFSIKPTGTQSHQAPMAYAGIYDFSDGSMRNSHSYFLRDWWEVYRGPLSIALTDTFTSDFFFKIFTPEMADRFWGLRQDSGDPFVFAEKAISFYESLGINPQRKMIVFSDGLNVELMVKLWDEFSNRIGVGFGIGTNLTFDVGYSPMNSIKPLSIVIKLTRANGKDVCKLSDNVNKMIGSEMVRSRFKRVFGCDGVSDMEVVY